MEALSQLMFTSTENTFHIKSVSVIIPMNWSQQIDAEAAEYVFFLHSLICHLLFHVFSQVQFCWVRYKSLVWGSSTFCESFYTMWSSWGWNYSSNQFFHRYTTTFQRLIWFLMLYRTYVHKTYFFQKGRFFIYGLSIDGECLKSLDFHTTYDFRTLSRI